MNILLTIIPIFIVIIIGWIGRICRFLQPEFISPANRLVYYLAIPAMIFKSISQSSFKTEFDADVMGLTLFSVFAVFAVSWCVSPFFCAGRNRNMRGAFIQSAFHGNLGYIGFAVVYYFLGSNGLVKASIIAGFIMILQNFLAVVVLQIYSENIPTKGRKFFIVKKILGNPVILSALAGILFSISKLPLPIVINRSLDILSSLAFPMALLLIGASLAFNSMRLKIVPVFSSSVMKLILLPGFGFFLYCMIGIDPKNYLPGLILLSTPTATITYVMAKEMKGDTSFSTAAISFSTIFSAVTFIIWLNIAG